MCLDIVTTPKKLKNEGSGYKIFYKTNRGNLYLAYRIGRIMQVPTGKWVHEKSYRTRGYKKIETIETRSLKTYPMGFHLHLNKRLADERFNGGKYVVIPIKFRNACAKGKQDECNIIVAKEILIPDERA